MDVTIRMLGRDDGAAFEAALAIYRSEIELSEQRPEDELRGLLTRDDYLVQAAERAGRVIGFSISWNPPDEDFWLFEYMAVLPEERGAGVGKTLFQRALTMPDPGNVGLVEVDQPRDEKTSRRLRFYARLGCRRVGDVSYILPLRTHGEPPPMQLLSVPLYGPTGYIRRETLQRALKRIYESVYHQPPDDPRIAQMLDELPPNVPLVAL
ncbi:MAG TPA: GNAT family N-acetyltransferase [Hyphomonadaceae bacterium]|jgi:GNAT superfamily N-acetyltransferase|nr:GNAT family N-acetyltransferase [Hyphomonadaceae bacterium]